jgi:hypothetical protein
VYRSQPSLRTPTVALSVRLALQGEASVAAELFVADVPRAGRAQLFDDLGALLEDEREFLPIALGARRVLVNRAAIAYVAVPRQIGLPDGAGQTASARFDADEISDVHTLFDHRCPVTVTLAGGGALTGTLLFSSPAERSRLVDFINLGPRFVRVWTHDELFLVQRSAIRFLAETAEAAQG